MCREMLPSCSDDERATPVGESARQSVASLLRHAVGGRKRWGRRDIYARVAQSGSR